MLGVPLPGAARWLKPQSERRSISPVNMEDSLAVIAPSELGRRLASRLPVAPLFKISNGTSITRMSISPNE